MNAELVEEYKNKIEPILPAAKRANGSRKKASPEHDASRKYTELLVEYREKGGSLPKLAESLGVAYSGVRRRVVLSNVSVDNLKPTTRVSVKSEEIRYAAQRVIQAKSEGMREYHDQLAVEYMNGIPLATLAKAIGLSSAAPLYYGIQRSIQRNR